MRTLLHSKDLKVTRITLLHFILALFQMLLQFQGWNARVTSFVRAEISLEFTLSLMLNHFIYFGDMLAAELLVFALDVETLDDSVLHELVQHEDTGIRLAVPTIIRTFLL